MSVQNYTLHWRDIEISIKFDPSWLSGEFSHLEIETVSPKNAPLPITQTGYKSLFHPIGTVEEMTNGDIAAFMKEWLDRKAASKEWKDYVERSRQRELF